MFGADAFRISRQFPHNTNQAECKYALRLIFLINTTLNYHHQRLFCQGPQNGGRKRHGPGPHIGGLKPGKNPPPQNGLNIVCLLCCILYILCFAAMFGYLSFFYQNCGFCNFDIDALSLLNGSGWFQTVLLLNHKILVPKLIIRLPPITFHAKAFDLPNQLGRQHQQSATLRRQSFT